jgi:hypothetical protein
MSAVEGENIGEYVWLSYDNDDTIQLESVPAGARPLRLAVSRETISEGGSSFSVDIYRLSPYYQVLDADSARRRNLQEGQLQYQVDLVMADALQFTDKS